MLLLRRACALATTAPILLVSCTDLTGLSGGDAGTNGQPDAGTDAANVEAAKCPPGQKECAGGCVGMDLPEYGCGQPTCERCSLPNAETIICEAGKCAVGTCKAGHASCDGNKQNGCEADLTDAKTCGSCTSACPTSTPLCNTAGQCVAACENGETQCGSKCVNLKTSATNCNACGNVCPAVANAVPKCSSGVCGFDCNVGFGECNPTSPGCEALSPYYRDGDGDGFGAGPKVGDACVAPQGHSQAAGDCLDTDPKVKPGQTQFFYTGYTNAAGFISYDYDCNDKEEVMAGASVGSCNACRVGDYVTVVRAKAPPNADLYCGSTTKIYSCSASASCATSSASTLGCR